MSKRRKAEWTCQRCTLQNKSETLRCTACDRLKPFVSHEHAPPTSTKKTSDERPGLSAAVNAIFNWCDKSTEQQHGADEEEKVFELSGATHHPTSAATTSTPVVSYLLQRHRLTNLDHRMRYTVTLGPQSVGKEDEQAWGEWKCPVPFCSAVLYTKNTKCGTDGKLTPVSHIQSLSDNIVEHLLWHYDRDCCLVTTYNLAGDKVGFTEDFLLQLPLSLDGGVHRYQMPGGLVTNHQRFLLTCGSILTPILTYTSDVIDMVLNFLDVTIQNYDDIPISSYKMLVSQHPAWVTWPCPVKSPSQCGFEARIYRHKNPTSGAWRCLHALNDCIRDHIAASHPAVEIFVYSEKGSRIK